MAEDDDIPPRPRRNKGGRNNSSKHKRAEKFHVSGKVTYRDKLTWIYNKVPAERGKKRFSKLPALHYQTPSRLILHLGGFCKFSFCCQSSLWGSSLRKIPGWADSSDRQKKKGKKWIRTKNRKHYDSNCLTFVKAHFKVQDSKTLLVASTVKKEEKQQEQSRIKPSIVILICKYKRRTLSQRLSFRKCVEYVNEIVKVTKVTKSMYSVWVCICRAGL